MPLNRLRPWIQPLHASIGLRLDGVRVIAERTIALREQAVARRSLQQFEKAAQDLHTNYLFTSR
jgi:hypothetical protein